MRRSPFRLSRRHQQWFYAATAVLFASGAAWLALDAWMAHTDPDAGPHPAEPWLMKIHGAAAMLILVVLGTLIPVHIRPAWRARANRFTGSIMVATMLALIVTGYGLYYAGGEQLRAWVARGHDVIGLALPLVIAWHVVRGRQQRRKNPPKP